MMTVKVQAASSGKRAAAVISSRREERMANQTAGLVRPASHARALLRFR
jgi:hypothetical protein